MILNKEDFICPITHKLLIKPVYLSDSHFYSKHAIDEWLRSKKTSPFTGLELLHTNYSECHIFNKQYKEFLNQNPDVMEEYKTIEKELLNIYMLEYLTEFINNIEYNKAIELLKINNKKIDCDKFLLKYDIYKNKELVILLINNSINLESIDKYKKKPIHYVCEYGNVEMLKLLIDNNVDLECEDKWNMKPIHYICQYGNIEMLKLLIDKNVDLESINKWLGMKPIHYVCQKGDIEMLKLLIDKNVDLEYINNLGRKPIKLIPIENKEMKNLLQNTIDYKKLI